MSGSVGKPQRRGRNRVNGRESKTKTTVEGLFHHVGLKTEPQTKLPSGLILSPFQPQGSVDKRDGVPHPDKLLPLSLRSFLFPPPLARTTTAYQSGGSEENKGE